MPKYVVSLSYTQYTEVLVEAQSQDEVYDYFDDFDINDYDWSYESELDVYEASRDDAADVYLLGGEEVTEEAFKLALEKNETFKIPKEQIPLF